MIKYRKKCHNIKCKKSFTAGKKAMYCSPSCREMQYRLRKGKGYDMLKKLLYLELGYVAKGDLVGIVNVVLSVINKWKKEK